MKGKRIFYCEISYALGIILLALGTAFMEKANFGMSMIVAPAYLIHLKLSQFIPFFSFGMSEYVFQAVLLILLAIIMRKVKKSYFLSFATAIIYGVILDVMLNLVALFPYSAIGWRIAFYVLGLLICTIGVSLLLHTYLPPEAYELIVKEIAEKLNMSIGKIKTIYDCCSCVLSIVLSLSLFGAFIGVNWGTVVCALVNGSLIGLISRWLEKKFIFEDAFPLREKLK